MFRFRNYYDRMYGRFNQADSVTRIIIIAALVLLLAALAPRLPGFGTGGDCLALAPASPSGSNQSVLATNVDPSVLKLQLSAETPQIVSGQKLVLLVRFYNTSMAPLTLFLSQRDVVLRYTGQEPGLVFSIQDANTARVLGESFAVRAQVAARQSFNAEELRVLGPQGNCVFRIELEPVRLNNAGIGIGTFRLVAVYRNTSRGALAPIANALTPTPVFENQGVWTGEVRSGELLVAITNAQ